MSRADSAGVAAMSRWDRPVLTLAGTTYAWSDVAAHARATDEWAAFAREVAEGYACERLGFVVPTAEVNGSATAFRRAHRLLTAEETETWLGARDLGVDEWLAAVRRAVLRRHHAADLPATAADGVIDDTWADGVVGGQLQAWAIAFAEHLVAPADAINDARVAETVAQHQVEWLRVDANELVLDTEDAAREAILALREGATVDEVAALAGVPHRVVAGLLEDLDDELGALLVGVRTGDVVGPVAGDGGFRVVRVEGKEVPSVDQPAIRLRAAELVRRRAVQRAIDEQVTWHDAL